jgi:hypothetical protein
MIGAAGRRRVGCPSGCDVRPFFSAATGPCKPFLSLPYFLKVAEGNVTENFGNLKTQLRMQPAFGNESVRPLGQTGGLRRTLHVLSNSMGVETTF